MNTKTTISALMATLLLSLAVAAQEASTRFELPSSESWQEAITRGTRQADGRPGEKLWRHDIAYRIEARLDTESHDLSGHATIRFRNGSPRPVTVLPLHLRQNFQVTSQSRRTERTGGVRLGDIKLGKEGQEKQAVIAAPKGSVLEIDLPEPLLPGDAIEVEIAWVHRVPKRGSPRQGRVDDELYYLGYWYPQVAVDDDLEGWVAEQYAGSGEFYMPYADYEVAFTAPENYIVQATGSLENPQEVLREEQRKRLEKAAATDEVVAVIDRDDLDQKRFHRDVESDLLTWKFKAENVRDFAVSCGRNYLWDALRVRVPEGAEPCMIHSFYRPGQEGWRRSAIAGRKAVEYGSRIYPYPWPHMSLCEGASGGGMEYPMMTTIAAGNSPKQVATVIIHEIIHMWFPMIAGSNEKRYAWMDEGMTSCLTALAADELFESGSDETRGELEDYRVMAARMSGEEPMMVHGDAYTTRNGYGIASYMKPSAVFHQLRLMLGDETFFSCLKEYVTDWAFKHPSPQDFFATFNRVSGRNLDWYFKEYCYETWQLDYGIDRVSHRNGRSQLVVASHGEAVMPTEIALTMADGKSHRIDLDLSSVMASKRVILDVEGEVVAAEIDPDRKLLDVNRRNNGWSK